MQPKRKCRVLTTDSRMLWLILACVAGCSVARAPPDDPNPGTQPNVVYYNQINTSANSTYQRNVVAVMEFLYKNNPPDGYATSLGYGGFPNAVYAHSGCYNMSDQPSCGQCIQNAYTNIQSVNLYAVGGAIWINQTFQRCRMRYDPSSFEIVPGTLGIVGPNISSPAPAPGPGLALGPDPDPDPAPAPAPAPPDPAPATGKQNAGTRNGVIAGAVVGGAVFCFVCAVLGFFLLTRRRRESEKSEKCEDFGIIKGLHVVFSYKDLCAATRGFSVESKLGQGGFGTVYKATLNNGSQVAVKKLSLQSNQGNREFVNEITIITGIQHRNLVRLKGYCVEADERLLVYEFLNKGSLDRALFSSGSNVVLDWHSRFQIAIGIARGLAYLHEESHVQIIHRDIKASNILLDDKLQPKISDFGISKLFDLDKGFGFTSTKVAGTLGYMAPEYATRGRLTTKADVFSYGILVLEIASGRKCVDPALPAEEELLLQLSWKLVMANRMSECIDKRLGGDYAVEEVSRLLRVAMLCTQEHEEARPTMSDVVAMLLGYLEIGALPTQAPFHFGQVMSSSTSTSSDYLNSMDMPR
ncbi:probable LRR receptor-like serine/threonine-protein kinase At1g56130 isoform X2 [Selaginella moellendorffii]|uniref:probable LRR receptor-like serine/threonine-protein kinase At1g56130 isoform X2 n=1 Tax=Selaginella moellendorffii TaxID=88036 RepID=UPI000D1C81F3|nr:probable LRR receptor-like serine/threonine-protein kinase At1g56130 isoform X2 [Selaginella moellendorffii]|eukprot:XP_024520236.1 probable LRR receptor-like serine/threonine-protein kinase At1g56130 isoform X2 [Selaginella moellendorffii]